VVSFKATFLELCNIQDDSLPASFHIQVNNPSSIGVSIGTFTLEVHALQDNLDTSDGQLAITMAIPALSVPGSMGDVDFMANLQVSMLCARACARGANDVALTSRRSLSMCR
jgi:hypothetical protein